MAVRVEVGRTAPVRALVTGVVVAADLGGLVAGGTGAAVVVDLPEVGRSVTRRHVEPGGGGPGEELQCGADVGEPDGLDPVQRDEVAEERRQDALVVPEKPGELSR